MQKLNPIFLDLMDRIMIEVRIRELVLNKYGFDVQTRQFLEPITGAPEIIYLCDFLKDFASAYDLESQPT